MIGRGPQPNIVLGECRGCERDMLPRGTRLKDVSRDDVGSFVVAYTAELCKTCYLRLKHDQRPDLTDRELARIRKVHEPTHAYILDRRARAVPAHGHPWIRDPLRPLVRTPVALVGA